MKNIDKLIEKYLDGTASPSEKSIVDKWYEQQGEEHGSWLSAESEESSKVKLDVWERINKAYGEHQSSEAKNSSRIVSWSKWMAAACVLVVGGCLFFNWWIHEDTHGSYGNRLVYEIKKDNSLKLAGGQTIILDSLLNEGLIDNNFLISRSEDGSIMFQVLEQAAAIGTWNTISTDDGGMYKVMLPDSTMMWLNASSTISFPSVFTNGRREVVLSGEAYFDVSHDVNSPFSVAVSEKTDGFPVDPDIRIDVLGTEFNVSAYPDNQSIQTTLVQGRVQIRDRFGSLFMKPNQRVVINTKNTPMVLEDVGDLGVVLAWKEGYFQFVDTSVEQMMKEVGRWYGVGIEYPDGIPPFHYTGKISRKLNVADIVESLNLSDIQCQLLGGKIVVYNYNKTKKL